MKIATILGTRPEIIRLSLTIGKLDELADKHTLIHTGQNFTHSLSDVFFDELRVRRPDHMLHSGSQTIGGQLAVLFSGVERILRQERPDKVLLLGDTNSALSAIVAERMGIPVVHMEAGNRCYDLAVPEEKNRRIIDAVATINMPYTRYSREHLLREGFPGPRIVMTGNPIYEVLTHYAADIEASDVLTRLGLAPGAYFLATAHRAENVDDPLRLKEIVSALNGVAEEFGQPVVCSIHPRTRSRLEQEDAAQLHPLVMFSEPFGFFDFVKLERHARCALTDSGTVQEECCIFHVPTVTMRTTTERPETVDCGSNIVAGVNAERIVGAVRVMLRMPTGWRCPEGYLDTNVSQKVVQYVLGGNSHVC